MEVNVGEPFVYIWSCVFCTGYEFAFIFFVNIAFKVAGCMKVGGLMSNKVEGDIQDTVFLNSLFGQFVDFHCCQQCLCGL